MFVGATHHSSAHRDCKGRRDLSKYERDKERMDEIAERLSERQDIWQDRYVYWIAVAVGHILEWVVRHEKQTGRH